MIAIPNGGARNAVTGARLKAEGVTAGAPDLFLFKPNGEHCGLAIEMKTRTGRQSTEQKAFQARLEESGYQYSVCRTVDEFITIVDNYLQALR